MPQSLHQQVLHPHSGGVWPCREPPTTAAPPKHVSFNLTPSTPMAADPGIVFPGRTARFFACTGEASSSRYLQLNCGLPAWQRDYTFFAETKKLRGVMSAPPERTVYAPRHTTTPVHDPDVHNIQKNQISVCVYLCFQYMFCTYILR